MCMLKLNQLSLLHHLKQYSLATVDTCQLLTDKNSLSTLLRLKYVSKNETYITLLKKGNDFVDKTIPLVVVGGNTKAKEKAARTSGVAALFSKHGIPSLGCMPPKDGNFFVPSNIWRRMRTAIISTSRFDGILQYNHERLAVYDIGNGHFEWQSYAEYSLFFQTHGKMETHAQAMLLICDDGKGVDIAKNIIKHTLWNRKRLIKTHNAYVTTKPQKYSRAPITVRTEYRRVILTERSDLMQTLEAFTNREAVKKAFCKNIGFNYGTFHHEPYCEYGTDPNRHRVYINLHNDLLLYVECFISAEPLNIYYMPHFDMAVPKNYIQVVTDYKYPIGIVREAEL